MKNWTFPTVFSPSHSRQWPEPANHQEMFCILPNNWPEHRHSWSRHQLLRELLVQHEWGQQCENQFHPPHPGGPGQSRLHLQDGFLRVFFGGENELLGFAWHGSSCDPSGGNAALCFLPGRSPPIRRVCFYFLLFPCSDDNIKWCLGEKGVKWSPARAEWPHVATISPTPGIYNSVHFLPFILSPPFSCANFFFPIFQPVSFCSEKTFNIPVVKQKLGTIKCYFILLCGCMVWHTGRSCWMYPCFGIKAEAFSPASWMGMMLKYIKITLHSLQEASPQILFFLHWQKWHFCDSILE